MSSTIVDGTRHLVALGFTELEAEVYVFLLREPQATGYRVAQGIGRTAANTYKALEALEKRGAVMMEDAEPRRCRAVPPAELLRGLERAFTRHQQKAAQALSRIGSDAGDDRVYQLRTPAQVYERCRTVLAGARQIVLMDVFPAPLAELREAVEEAIGRGVRVAVLAYEPVAVDGAEVVLNHEAENVRGHWPGQWVNLAADSTQQVHALMTPDGAEVVHATWSGSAFLAHLYQSGLLGEITASAVRRALAAGQSNDEIAALLARLDRLKHSDTAAFASLTTAPLRPRPRARRDP
jgi:sugar-specific transcriptional regulator TrmB